MKGGGRPTAARVCAAEALVRIEVDGAYAALALSAEIERLRLNAQDRALATQLVYGVLRWRGRIDHLIGAHSKRAVGKLTAWTRNCIRLAVYQAVFLPSIPPPVACAQSVALVKVKEPWAAGYVNAVCRRAVAKPAATPLPDPDDDPARFIAVSESHPAWLVERWLARWGYDHTLALCRANNESAAVTLRVNLAKGSREELCALLEEAGLEAELGRLAPTALKVKGGGAVEGLPGYGEGRFQVQDEASQLVAWVVDPEPGARIVELCAGPGGKVTHLAECMAAREKEAAASGTREPAAPTRLRAYEIHAHKARLIEMNALRLGLADRIEVRVDDARVLAGEIDASWDRVVVDAPCSGTGVLRRRPDLKWRRRSEEIPDLVRLQRQILRRAAALIAPGGALIYTTCSVETEENEENAAWFLSHFPDFRAIPVEPLLPTVVRNDAPAKEGLGLRLWPHHHDTDGFYFFRAERTK